jgi:hypothetical protein
MQARQVRVEFRRVAGTRPERLEHAVTQLESPVEDRQVPTVGRQELAVDPDVTRSSVRC